MKSCDSCGGCGGCSSSGSCGGCANRLELHRAELDFLQKLAQIPFLPVARRADDMTPVYLEDSDYTREEYSLILQCLEKKALVSIDYDSPLKGADMGAYKGYPVHGSVALTARGIGVVEMLQMQGAEE